MKVTLQAKPLAAALSLAAALVDAKVAEKVAVLGAVHVVAQDDAISVTTNVLDHALTLSLAAAVEVTGEVAVSAARLAALVAGFPPDSEITIASGDKAAQVSSGRARFRLAALPLADLSAPPAIDKQIGAVELEREQLLTLLSRPAFAISNEETRYYLKGICLHDSAEGLTAVGTNGHRLARVVLPHVAGLARGHRPIVPLAAIKIILKLLGDKAIERLTLRCSKTLLEIASASFTYVSRLIDGTFPDYQRLVPAPSSNSVTVERAVLARAVERIAAVAPDAPDYKQHLRLVGLIWKAPAPALHLSAPRSPDIADDLVEAEVSGHGRVAVQIRYLAQLLDELEGDRIQLDAGTGLGGPIRVDDFTDENFLGLIVPCVWGAEASQAA